MFACRSLLPQLGTYSNRTPAVNICVSVIKRMASGDISKTLTDDISIVDPELLGLLKKEKHRQNVGLELIASENFASKTVQQCLGSCLTNKYSEGYPGQRYYGGTEVIDEVERLCQQRALAAFRLDGDKWGVNVQPYSGSPANFAVYTALVGPHGRIMGLDLPDGGHLTHGFQTATKKVSATSVFFETLPYKVKPDGLIDYDELERNASLFKPKLIIAGMTCYSRHLDYERFRKIANQNGSYLMADMAHISGLVAADVIPGPFEHCDIVTTTTHKSLRGPRAGVIFYRKGLRRVLKSGKEEMYNIEGPINEAVFPGLQGGPHNHQIAAIAATMHLAAQPEFKEYQLRVLENCQTLHQALAAKGYEFVAGGSENHLLLMSLRSTGVDGARVQNLFNRLNVVLNKNTVPGDTSALKPNGIRIGTPALTTRGFGKADFEQVADFIHRGIELAKEVKAAAGGPLLSDFNKQMDAEPWSQKIADLRAEVEKFSSSFPVTGAEY